MMSKWFVLSGLLWSFGCAPVAVDMDLDEDGDGLLNSEEAELGTDPNNPDSDDDHPYLGNYPISRCDPEASGTGYAVGDVSHDFELEDQHGETVKLSDFCGNVVVLIAAAEW